MYKFTYRYSLIKNDMIIGKGKHTGLSPEMPNYYDGSFDKEVFRSFNLLDTDFDKCELSIKVWNSDHRKVYDSNPVFTINSLCVDDTFDSDINALKDICIPLWSVK